MSKLGANEYFDIIQGGGGQEDTSAYVRDFRPHSTILPANALTCGDVVYVRNESGLPRIDRVTLSTYATPVLADLPAARAAIDALFEALQDIERAILVLEGMTDRESGYYGSTVTTVAGSYIFETGNFEAGAYVPGAKVSVAAGLPKLRVATEPAWGEVVEYDDTAAKLTIAVGPRH